VEGRRNGSGCARWATTCVLGSTSEGDSEPKRGFLSWRWDARRAGLLFAAVYDGRSELRTLAKRAAKGREGASKNRRHGRRGQTSTSTPGKRDALRFASPVRTAPCGQRSAGAFVRPVRVGALTDDSRTRGRHAGGRVNPGFTSPPDGTVYGRRLTAGGRLSSSCRVCWEPRGD